MLLKYERKYWSRGIHLIAGVDEAGRGPLAGPVVAAAVIFPEDVVIEGVNDSKKLTEKKREELFGEIHARALAVGVGIVGHEEIDRINILQASILAMTQAIAELTPVPEQLLVDGNFFRHAVHPVENIVKGDALSHSIAAASIVAKVTRDRLMCELDALYPGYEFARHKGYGTSAHIDAILALGYSPVHRRSFHVAKLEGLIF
ncbi:MAG TPA: ribonuclease HII [Bacteroidota bacterium]|nr:ribonuclease HII [Bacteroidota bacterium]